MFLEIDDFDFWALLVRQEVASRKRRGLLTGGKGSRRHLISEATATGGVVVRLAMREVDVTGRRGANGCDDQGLPWVDRLRLR